MFLSQFRSAVENACVDMQQVEFPPSKEELDRCMAGYTIEFRTHYWGNDHEDGLEYQGWDTRFHFNFYKSCVELMQAERKELASRMQRYESL